MKPLKQFEAHQVYRHMNNQDVDMYVVKVGVPSGNKLPLVVVWLNRHYPDVSHNDKVNVPLARIHEWKQVS